MKKIIIALVILILLALTACTSTSLTTTQSIKSEITATNIVASTTSVVIASGLMSNQYALQLDIDKVICVSDMMMVSMDQPNTSNEILVHFLCGTAYVDCVFEGTSGNGLLSLQQYQSIEIQGIYGGLDVYGFPLLTNCSVIPN